jgi:hypothetical protein
MVSVISWFSSPQGLEVFDGFEGVDADKGSVADGFHDLMVFWLFS